MASRKAPPRRSTRPAPADAPSVEATTTPPPMASPLPLWLVLGVPAVVAVLIRAWYLPELWHDLPLVRRTVEGFDQHTYNTWAQEIAAGDWLSRARGVFYYSPLYAYLLGIVYAVAGRESLVPALVLNAVFGVAATVSAAGLARVLFTEPEQPRQGGFAGLAAGVLMALNGSQLAYESATLNDGVLPAFLLGGLWAFVSLLGKITTLAPEGNNWRRAAWWLLPGVLFGIAVTGRASNLLPAAALAGWLAWSLRGPDWRVWRAWLPLGVFLAGLALPVGVVVLRNVAIGGTFAITTNGPINFYLGNAPGSLGVFSYPPGFEAANQEVRQHPKAEQPDAWRAKLWEDLAKIPGALSGAMGRKTKLFFNAWDAPDNLNSAFLRRRLMSLKLSLPPYALYVMGLAGLTLTLPWWRRLMPVYLFAGAFAVSLILVFVAGRYKLPFLGVLAVLAGGGVGVLASQWKTISGMRWGLAGGALVLGALAFLPRPVPKEAYAGLQRPNDFLQHAAALREAGRAEEAEVMLADGEELFPGMPQFPESRARVALEAQDWAGVLKVTTVALQKQTLSPGLIEMHLIALVQTGQMEQAQALARQVAPQLPNSAIVRQLTEVSGAPGGAPGEAPAP